MKLFAMEASAFAARSALREKTNLTISADAIRRSSPTVRIERVTDGVAVIDIRGVMLASPDPLDEFFGGFTNTRAVTRLVESAANDSAVKAIILRVDSPGGSVEGLAELGDAVRSASRRKRVVAQVEGLAASAAYYVASAASEIVAGRMDLVGSIGTVLVVFDASKAFADAGLRVVPIVSGKFKATGTLGTPLTADEQAYLQGIVDSYFADFRRAVMSGRGVRLSLASMSAVSDGRIFPATNALELGLVDSLGTFNATMQRLTAPSPTSSQRMQARVQRSRLAVLSLGR